MEKLQKLAKLTCRLWYTDRQIVLIDLLTRYQCLKEEELVFQMKLNTHEVRKALGALKLDKFVKIEYRPEIKRYDGRVINKIYYYIDYKSLYDATKYKLWKIQKYFQQKTQTEKNERNYHCKVCRQVFTQIEATSFRYGDDMLFRCPYHRPDEYFFLQLEEEKEGESHVSLVEFMTVARPMIELLKEIEGMAIPAYKPVGESITYVDDDGKVVTRLKGDKKAMKDLQQQHKEGLLVADGEAFEQNVSVEIKDQHMTTEELAAKAEEEKMKKKTENLMPEWHQKSTIVKDDEFANNVDHDDNEDEEFIEAGVGDDHLPSSVGEEETADIMSYYENYYSSFAAPGDEQKKLKRSRSPSPEKRQKEQKFEGSDDEEEEFLEITG